MARHPLAASRRDLISPDPIAHRNSISGAQVAPLWPLTRVVLGWLWLDAGWSQLGDLPGPIGHLATSAGASVAILLPAIALTVAGIALILGLLVGPAAVVGGVLSISAWSGGSPLLAALQGTMVVLLVLGWRSAGRIGLDRWLLPLLGVSGQGGELIGQRRSPAWRSAAAAGAHADQHKT